jgi:predicted MPP superfamily phosphohydrolase
MRGPKPFRIFLLVILALTPFAQAFWFGRAWQVIAAVPWAGPRSLLQALWMAAGLLVLATLIDALAGPLIPRRGLGAWGLAVSRLWLIASCLSYVAVTAVGSVEWLSQPAIAALPARPRQGLEPATSLAFRGATYLAGSLPLLAAAYGVLIGRRRYRIVAVEVPIAGLPPSLDGLRIVQLSDLHIGDFMPRAAIRRAVDLANTLRPDLAVVTGDLITDAEDPLEDCIAELSRLRAPLGVWGCNGNHERWAGLEARAQALFQRYGMRLLRQECAVLSWRGGAFNLIGVDDQRDRQRAGNRAPVLHGVEALVRPDMPNILLSHNPDTFERAAALGIELTLAGHTHGGQLRFALGERQWSAASFITPFVAGLYRLPLGQDAQRSGAETMARRAPCAFLYVNSGLGTFGLPVRLGVRPEITVLTLRAWS